MSRWPQAILGDVVVAKSGNGKIIKGTLATENDGKLFPAYSATGQDVFSEEYDHEGDGIVVSAVGARCGKCFLAGGKWRAIANTHVLLPRKEKVMVRFLWYLINDENFWVKGGTAQPFVKVKDSLCNQIPLPPIAEQEWIVRVLDEAKELCHLRAQTDARANGLATELFRQMFGDPGLNPMGWKIRRAGDLMALCEYGSSQKASDVNLGIPMLRMNNVTPDGRLDLSDLKTVELEEDDIEKYRLEASDVLFNRTNSRELVGKTGMWDGRFEAVAASYFIRVRFDQSIEHPQHFTSFMNLPLMKRRLFEMARGAIGQANINAQELKSIEIPVPPIELQRTFAHHIAEIRTMEITQADSRKRLYALFQSLRQRAFQGEL